MLPLFAVVGNEKAKEALSLLLVNPAITSLLIVGERGSGKSTLAKGISSLTDELAYLPVETLAHELEETLNLEETLKSGTCSLDRGFLSRAQGKIVILEDVHLFEPLTLHTVIRAARFSGDFSIVATMREEGVEEDDAIKEMFSMIVRTDMSFSVEERIELLRRCVLAEKNERYFLEEMRRLEKEAGSRIERGKHLLNQVTIPFALKEQLASQLEENRVEGNHFEGIVLEIVRALSAMAGRQRASMEDLTQAWAFVFSERILPLNIPPERPEKEETNSSSPEKREEDTPASSYPKEERTSERLSAAEERIFSIGHGVMPVFEDFRRRVRKGIPGSGRQAYTRSENSDGRLLYCEPTERYEDIDLFGTLKKAALFQKRRGKVPGKAFIIKKCDLQKKVRERGVGRHLLLLVDASASLGVNERMESVKGAILNLLEDAYVHREKVGMLCFSDNRCEEILPMTRSLHLAKKRLEELPTGGNTPLALGMKRAAQTVRSLRLKEPDALIKVYVISDGRANRSEEGISPRKEALTMADLFFAEQIDAYFIDYEQGRFRLHLMRELAKRSAGRYVHMDTFQASLLGRMIGERE